MLFSSIIYSHFFSTTAFIWVSSTYYFFFAVKVKTHVFFCFKKNKNAFFFCRLQKFHIRRKQLPGVILPTAWGSTMDTRSSCILLVTLATVWPFGLPSVSKIRTQMSTTCICYVQSTLVCKNGVYCLRVNCMFLPDTLLGCYSFDCVGFWCFCCCCCCLFWK